MARDGQTDASRPQQVSTVEIRPLRYSILQYRMVLSVCVSFSSFRFNPDIIGTLEEYVSFQVTVSINTAAIYKVVY